MSILLNGLKDKLGFRTPQASKPYSELARFYDRMMDHVDYVSWANYISAIFRHFNKDVHSVFETACGTGSLAVELHRLGYEVTCMDASQDMLEAAYRKFRENGVPSRLLAGDMKAIPVNKLYDAVLCIYDSINYMMNPVDFHRAVEEASTMLGSGGLFIFDVCTVKNSELFFDDREMSEYFEDGEYDRKCRYDPYKRIQKNFFIIRGHGTKMMTEMHAQKIYSLDEVEDMIRGTDFLEVGRFEDLSFDPGTEDSERVHFVLERK